MRITELLTKDTIILNLKSKTKREVIDELVNKLYDAGRLNGKEEYKRAILRREEEFSTGVGDGVAIPHAKTSAVKLPSLAFGYSKEGIDYDSLDGQPAHIFFMIAGQDNADNEHLETLSRLSVMLMDESFKNKIPTIETEEDLLRIIDDQENEDLNGETNGNEEKVSDKIKENVEEEKQRSFVLGVTACPTGIAHTYMAADALRKKAAEMGVDIKVETNGSTGVKNQLTEEEINKAEAIIVAADKQVEMARFEGKKLIQVSVVQGIKSPEELITKAINGDAPIYHHTSGTSEKVAAGSKEINGFYKHLMNGVSNMLPFVVGGGILIALSFMFGINSANPNDPTFHPIAKLLSDIGGGSAFALMIPVLAGFIGMSIADRPGFAPAMAGGLIAASNGAGFLGGLIAGFLGGYVIVLLKKIFSRLPQSLEGIKPVLLYPLFGILVTGAVMLLVIVNPVKAINLGLQDWLGSMGTSNRIILGLILGGMMAGDMGGPINKAAFTFGIAMIEAGNYGPHAAIMAGGMVPPLGIAIATTIFKNRFTKDERDAGKTCYIMGASFITEGAIPFAASDPGRVIPSVIIGSAVAGALTMMFNIGLPAPHGGLFVIPVVVGSKLMYILSILIGSFITAFILGMLKKPMED
ncbi:PTS fructose transporter subunit IIA [Clostridium bovifaecis]|uniref:PTS fructose transporter subunit IIA n=1 Tax=Clostridium bovifaecis TaxID=2184719 RepID=A0A6I6F6F3_9CLOT|nr:PTS fructose transporter subunit IIA [Clostridium bovifaecis]